MFNARGDLPAPPQETMSNTQTPALAAALDGISGTLEFGGFLRLAPDGLGNTVRAQINSRRSPTHR
jgi:hypothetical protein